MKPRFLIFHATVLLAPLLMLGAPAAATDSPVAAPLPAMAWADLTDLSEAAPLIARLQLRSIVPIEPARATGVRAGYGRFYVEARTEALIAGAGLAGIDQRFLVDLPIDAKGKPAKLKKTSAVVFARSIAGRPGELQLVAPDAIVGWDSATDAQLRAIIGELLGGNAPPRITGVREAIFVPGNLAGEGETQLFLGTPDGSPAAITVLHRAGQPPAWSVAFSEVLDAAGRPPQRDTLGWYRLACFLPPALPAAAHVSANAADRAQAAEDYALVRGALGACGRLRK